MSSVGGRRGIACPHAGENVAAADLRTLAALLSRGTQVLRDPIRRGDGAADNDGDLIAHRKLAVGRRDAQHIYPIGTERDGRGCLCGRAKRRRTGATDLSPKLCHRLRRAVIRHKGADDQAIATRHQRPLRRRTGDIHSRRAVIVLNRHVVITIATNEIAA